MKWFFVFLIFFLIFGCAQPPQEETTAIEGDVEVVQIATDDKVYLSCNLFMPKSGKGEMVLFLHQLNSNKESWNEFANILREKGFVVLAVDFRGHGESNLKDQEEYLWEGFGEREFDKFVPDMIRVLAYLTDKFSGLTLHIVGASIGANTAINTAEQFPEVDKVVLLSPSFEYRGIKTGTAANSINIPVLIISSSEDEQSFDDSKQLAGMAKRGELIELEGKGHGTDMIKGDTELMNRIITWLKE